MGTNIEWTDVTDNIIAVKGGGWWCKKISPDDCRAEGHAAHTRPELSQECNDDAARDWYMDLWDSINGKQKPGKPDISWKANPWVWSIHFKKLS